MSERCPECGSEVRPSQWRPRQAWFGNTIPDPGHHEFFPARCTNDDCAWEGPKDDTAVREAQERRARGE